MREHLALILALWANERRSNPKPAHPDDPDIQKLAQHLIRLIMAHTVGFTIDYDNQETYNA